MSFDKIFDLTAGVYFNSYNTLHVVLITRHTHDRRKSIGKKKNQRKEKKIKAKRDKKTQDKERKQGKEERKNVTLADPRN